MLQLTVIVPTHNPHAERLQRTLGGLRAQDLPIAEWELILVDNASEQKITTVSVDLAWHPASRLVREEELGLTPARMRGFLEATKDLCVLVDDDNVLQSDFLSRAVQLARRHPAVGIFGGKSLPEFEVPPPAWLDEFYGMLGLRDDGDKEMVTAWQGAYPPAAPIGAGMVIRRDVALRWVDEVERDPQRRQLDRAGTQLVSGGDNDIVITVMKQGFAMGYFPTLVLTHLIPATRCSVEYLARLSRAMSKSWMQLLSVHGINPWPQIGRWSVPLRQIKAWFTHRAWSGPAARIRWAGACGHFEGRAVNSPATPSTGLDD